jgi:hypothetical protein
MSLSRQDDELAAPLRKGRTRHEVMAVIGSSAVGSCQTSIAGLLQGTVPVEIVRVRLSRADGVVFDSKQWQAADRDPVELAVEIAQYITDRDSQVEATIVGWSYRAAN